MSIFTKEKKPEPLISCTVIDRIMTCDLCTFQTGVWKLMDFHMSKHITGKWSGS